MIDKESINSCNIFLFPFSLKNCGDYRTTIVKALEQCGWQRNEFNYLKGNFAQNFSSQAYFYDFASGAIFDDNSENKTLEAYSLPIGESATYTIKVKKFGCRYDYQLNLEKIELRVYDEKVAILSFHLLNTNYTELEDILRINDYGRRIFPEYLATNNSGDIEVDITKNSFLADTIEIDLDNGRYFAEDFANYVNQKDHSFNLPMFIKGLLPTCLHQIKWLLDDRMYVVCWYKNKGWSEQLKKIDFSDSKLVEEYDDENTQSSIVKNWYQFVFIDNDGASCHNKYMFAQLLSKATYVRWGDYGTFFGVSRYSFVAIENDVFTQTHMRTMYYYMAALCLAQRTLALYYSYEISEISSRMNDRELRGKELFNRVRELNLDYLRFVNNIYFREITPTDQGIELYNLMQEQMQIPRDEQGLSSEVDQLYNYMNLTIDQRRNDEASALNILATIAVPATIVTGIFGMNQMAEITDLYKQLACVFGSVIVVYVGYKCYKWYRKNKS